VLPVSLPASIPVVSLVDSAPIQDALDLHGMEWLAVLCPDADIIYILGEIRQLDID